MNEWDFEVVTELVDEVLHEHEVDNDSFADEDDVHPANDLRRKHFVIITPQNTQENERIRVNGVVFYSGARF